MMTKETRERWNQTLKETCEALTTGMIKRSPEVEIFKIALKAQITEYYQTMALEHCADEPRKPGDPDYEKLFEEGLRVAERVYEEHLKSIQERVLVGQLAEVCKEHGMVYLGVIAHKPEGEGYLIAVNEDLGPYRKLVIAGMGDAFKNATERILRDDE